MISIKNFVTTDIEVLTQSTNVFEGFRTTLYFAPGTVTDPDVDGGNFATVGSMDEFGAKVSASNAVTASVQAYFNNGGSKLCFVSPTSFKLEDFKSDLVSVSSVVDDFYYVCISNSLVVSSGGYGQANSFVDIANFASGNGWSDSDLSSLQPFRVCVTTDDINFVVGTNVLNTTLAVKYSTYKSENILVDAALLIGAYFSKIDVTQANQILDYNFTPEVLGDSDYEDVTQSQFELLNNNPTNGNYNFIGKVANRVVNIGGDYCSPQNISMALDFGASCIERDLDYSLIELLFGKLPLTQEGQSKLIDAIKSQLTKYVDNGFLERDATYSGPTQTTSYNGVNYTIISTGDVLPLGYKVFYVPISSISSADRSAKRFPYIYVALQSVHGARVIQINGGIV